MHGLSHMVPSILHQSNGLGLLVLPLLTARDSFLKQSLVLRTPSDSVAVVDVVSFRIKA